MMKVLVVSLKAYSVLSSKDEKKSDAKTRGWVLDQNVSYLIVGAISGTEITLPAKIKLECQMHVYRKFIKLLTYEI